MRETDLGEINESKKQDKILPPSKPSAGSRFMTAKAIDATVNKRVSKGIEMRLIVNAESMFVSGPARHKAASFT